MVAVEMYEAAGVAAAASALQRLGDTAKFDISLDGFISAGGTYPNAVSFTVTVYLKGAEKQMLAGGGENEAV